MELKEENDVITKNIQDLQKTVRAKKTSMNETQRDLVAKRQEYEATIMEIEAHKADFTAKTLSLESKKTRYEDELRATRSKHNKWKEQEQRDRLQQMDERVSSLRTLLTEIEVQEKSKLESLQREHQNHMQHISTTIGTNIQTAFSINHHPTSRPSSIAGSITQVSPSHNSLRPLARRRV